MHPWVVLMAARGGGGGGVVRGSGCGMGVELLVSLGWGWGERSHLLTWMYNELCTCCSLTKVTPLTMTSLRESALRILKGMGWGKGAALAAQRGSISAGNRHRAREGALFRVCTGACARLCCTSDSEPP